MSLKYYVNAHLLLLSTLSILFLEIVDWTINNKKVNKKSYLLEQCTKVLFYKREICWSTWIYFKNIWR